MGVYYRQFDNTNILFLLIQSRYHFYFFRPEALTFLILYTIYCIAMAYNSHFEAWAKDKLPVPDSWRQAQAQQAQLREEGSNYKTIHKVQYP